MSGVATPVTPVFLVHVRPLLEFDDHRVARHQQSKAVHIGPQRRSHHVAIAAVVLGAGNREPVAEPINLLGLIEYTLKLRSISVSTMGPCGTSIAMWISSGVPPVVAMSQSDMRASPSPLCATWSRPRRFPSQSVTTMSCFSLAQSTAAYQHLSSLLICVSKIRREATRARPPPENPCLPAGTKRNRSRDGLGSDLPIGQHSRELCGEFLHNRKVVNTMVDQLSSFASEVTRVAREVGTEGKLGGQASVKGVAGTWKGLTDNVNLMAANLTAQVRNIAEVTTAVAKGDLSRKIAVEVRGEILDLKNTINTMVDQLSSFASEVARVAHEVGTEGKLGGQARVVGVAVYGRISPAM